MRECVHACVHACEKGVLCTAKKRGGGGEARGFSTVRGAPQNGDGRVETDFEIMRLTAQPHHKICIFFKRGTKNFRKRGKFNAQKKERPEVAWLTVTMRRATGCPDVGAGRIRAADRPKNFNRFESHFQHLSNEDEGGRRKPDL